MTTQQTFESWVTVELMGHGRMAGYLTERNIAGASFLQIDVPEAEGLPAFTRFVSPQSIFAINPCDERTARLAAARFRPEPIEPWIIHDQVKALRDGKNDHINPEGHGDDI